MYDVEDERRADLAQMREDMLIEIKLRNDDDYFYDHMEDLVAELDDIRYRIENECELYGRDGSDWFELFTEK